MKLYEINYLNQHDNLPFIYHRLEEEEITYSYKEILQNVQDFLCQIEALKVRKGKGIALKLEDHSAAEIVLVLGILNHDSFFCALNLADDVIIAKERGAHYLISNVNQKDLNQQFMKHLFILNEKFYVYSIEETLEIIDKDICYAMGTSGSTGKPKTVFVPYACIFPNVKALSLKLNIESNDCIFLSTPLTFDPFVIEIFLALYKGASLLIIPHDIRLMPHKLISKMFPIGRHQKGASIWQTTPSLFRLMGAETIRQCVLNSNSPLRVLLLGGEEFPTLNQWINWIPNKDLNGKSIFNIYGITELSCWSSLYKCPLSWFQMKDSANQKIPLGSAIDDETVLQIIDEHGEILQSSGQGELQVGSKTRRCYIPEHDGMELRNTSVPLFRNTGDLVELNEKGDIFYVGRSNRCIKRFGKRINLESLEKQFEALLTTVQASVNVICLWKGKLICCICMNPSGQQQKELASELIAAQAKQHEKPDQIVYLQKIPLSAHGKIDYEKLYQISRNKIPKNPPQIFQQFLMEVCNVSLEEDIHTDEFPNKPPTKILKSCKHCTFLQLGGTSFQALSLATQINEFLDNSLQQKQILEMLLSNKSTILEILQFLHNAKWEMEPQKRSHDFEVKNISLKWSSNFDKCIDSSPSIARNSYIIVGSHSHKLQTLNAFNGDEVIASISLPDRIECQVEFIDGTMMALVGCYDGCLYAFDYLKGSIEWSYCVGGMIKAKPLVSGEQQIVIVGSYAKDYNLKCICMKTLGLKWQRNFGDRGIYSSPVNFGDNSSLLICTLTGLYAKIEALTGKVIWTQQCKSPIFSTPAMLNGGKHFVLAEVAGLVHICCKDTGNILNSFEAAGNIYTSFAINSLDNLINKSWTIVFGCHDQHLYCLEYAEQSNSLQSLWKTCLNSAIYATPLLIKRSAQDSSVVVCTTKGQIVNVHLKTSEIMGFVNIESEIFSSPCGIENKYIYFGCRNNNLYCYELENGKAGILGNR